MVRERDNILISLEKCNHELTKAFEYHNKAKNMEWPNIDDDSEIDPNDQKKLVEIYEHHKASLKKIIECSGNLKKEIEELEKYFEDAEYKFPRQCSNCVESLYSGNSLYDEKKYCNKTEKDITDVYCNVEHGWECLSWRMTTSEIFREYKKNQAT